MSKANPRKYFRDIDPDKIDLIHQQLNGEKLQLILNKPLVLAMKKYKIASLLPVLILPIYFLMDMILEFMVGLNWFSPDISTLIGGIILPVIFVLQILSSQLTKNKLYQLEIQFKSKVMDINPVMGAIYGILRAEGFREFRIEDDSYFSEIKSRFGIEPESMSFVVTHNTPVETIIFYGRNGNLGSLKLSLSHMVKLIEGGVSEDIFNLNPTTVQLDYNQKAMTIKGKDTLRWEGMTKTLNKKQIILIGYVGIMFIMFTVLLIFTENTGLAYFYLFFVFLIIVFPTKINKFSINNKVIKIKMHTHFDPVYIEYAMKNRLKRYFDVRYMTHKDHPGSYEGMKLYFMWGKLQLFQLATQLLENENTFEMTILVKRKHSKEFFSSLQLDLGNFLVFNDQEKLLDRLYPEEEDILSKQDNLIRDIQDAEITKREKQLEKVSSLTSMLKNMNFKKLIPLGIALLLVVALIFLSTSASMDKYIVYQETSQFHDYELKLDQYSFIKIEQVAIDTVETQTMYGRITIDKVDTEYMNWQNWENEYHYDREYWLAEDTELRIELNSDAEFELIIYAGYNHPSSIFPILALLLIVLAVPIILVLQIHNKEGENIILHKLYPKSDMIDSTFDINAMTSPEDLGTDTGLSFIRIVVFILIAQVIFFVILFILLSQDILTTQIMAFYSLGSYESLLSIKSIYLMWTAFTLYVLAGRKRDGIPLRNISIFHIVSSFIILPILHPGMRSFIGLVFESYF